MCSLDIHEWSFRYTQTHFSVIYQQQSVCAHLRAPGQHQQWAVVVCQGTEDICSGLVSHSPRLSKCDPKVNCPCLLPGITRQRSQEPRDLLLNWQKFLTVREMFSFAASSLHNLKCLSAAGFCFLFSAEISGDRDQEPRWPLQPLHTGASSDATNSR